MTDASMNLGHLFDEMNQKYFGGKLKKRPVRWADWKRTPRMGHCMRRAIYLHRGLSAEQAHATLIHEMCHIRAGRDHGEKFKAAMRQVQARGAPVSEVDLKPGFSPHRNLPNTIDDIATDPTFKTWREVRSYLARELYVSGPELERKYPWARKRWKRVRNELKADDRRSKAIQHLIAITKDSNATERARAAAGREIHKLMGGLAPACIIIRLCWISASAFGL